MPEPVPHAPDLEGRLVAERYRVGPVIATGGMAQVRRAEDVVLGRQVAIKILHPHLAADPAVRERFRHEAISAARLTHPAIVSIYDTVIDDDVNAIVMELVDGITLRQFLDQKGHLSPRDAVDVVAGVADALQTAHEAGIVHRDVKPANILLCDDRRVMVTDFGIAKAAVDEDLTRDGTIIGTAKYLAPEQVSGDPVDPRTDVYSLGVVLYECLCGRPPFEADTEAATALARLHRDPLRPRQVRPSVPRSLDAIAMEALARDPDDRPPTAAALRAAVLGAALDDPVVAGSDHTVVVSGTIATTDEEAHEFVRSERRWLVPTLLVVLVGGALVLAAMLIGRTEAGQQIFDRAREVVGAGPTDEGDDSDVVVQVVGAAAYDPFGSGVPGENDELVGLAHDGDPATVWPTEFYGDRFLGTKDGVGLAITLDRVGPLGELVVTSPSDDWGASVFVREGMPEDFDGWGEAVTGVEGATPGETRFDLGGATGDTVLLWLTDLGPAEPGEFRVEIAEVAVSAR